MVDLLRRILSRVRNNASAVWRSLAPLAEVPAALVDAVRSRRELLVENAVLRHQIVVLRRRMARPTLTPVDRLRLLLAARLLPGWRRAVVLVQPQTILRWTAWALIRDRDAKFGGAFDRAATGAAIRVIKTAVRAPDMNAIAERFAGSLRREMLDHVLVLDDHHLARLAREYGAFFNRARPHQGIAQRTPVSFATASGEGEVIAYPVLGGLHHDYRRAA